MTADQASIALSQIAHARSGDKGNHANIGVIAYTPEGFAYLRQTLTARRVAEFFAGLGPSRVERFELPRLWALNFLLYDALGGGASRSLRIDTQGKLLSTAIGELTLPRPESLELMERPRPAGTRKAEEGIRQMRSDQ
ncbi:MAG TPA: hypothetical protein VGX78_19535 [Pirellulales bacterium]|jgi:hypothetical protein|nr:hypothetical protein [Pirellulales bacterium]